MKKVIISCMVLLSFFPAIGAADLFFGAFDPAHWHGLVMVKEDRVFAFRFVINRGGERADGYDTFYLVESVGPFAPDGRFAQVGFNPCLPFGRKNETPVLKKELPPEKQVRLRYGRFRGGVVGQVTIPEGIGLEIIFYNPWEAKVDYRLRGGEIVGMVDGPRFSFIPLPPGWGKVDKRGRELVVRPPGDNIRSFSFYAGFQRPALTPEAVNGWLAAASREYEESRPAVTGEWRGLASAISYNLGWMRLYQPDRKRVYIPAGRRWIFPAPDGSRDLWTIFEWDAFFNALEAVVEDRETAAREIEAVLDCQYPWGNIPNWRSPRNGSPDRSQPPVGAFGVLKVYYRSGDLSLLTKAYEPLKRWHYFWTDPGLAGTPRRDGNRDGLLEWGSDRDRLADGVPEWERNASGRQRAAWESGQDDLPNFDRVPFNEERGTLEMNCLDLSCLYALDAEMMARIAGLLGRQQEADEFRERYRRIREKINGMLWNRDFYYDRLWDGTFSTHRAASNFYPLIAGVPDKKRADSLVAHLLSPKEFWGTYVIPTISRDHPAFKDQQYWRGTIWPPTNYLVYQGLKRYYRDEIAAVFARRSAALFMASWQTFGLCRENYDSRSGRGGGQRYQSWGPLFALVLLEDFIDICPFDGFRLGNLAATAESRLQNIFLAGHRYRLDVDRRSLKLFRQGLQILRFDGRGVLRHVDTAGGRLCFEAHVLSQRMDIYPVLFGGRPFTVRLGEGEPERAAAAYVRLPRGRVKVTLEKIK